ncbi:MAG: hypothetical protein ACXAC7_06270 [Candidatus Hodarchaeales archaeon]
MQYSYSPIKIPRRDLALDCVRFTSWLWDNVSNGADLTNALQA